LQEGASLLDVGCGAGFPSLVLAILRPDLSITALDSTEKRVRYVASAAALLGLVNLKAVCMRAEDGAKGELRESFDAVTARAVARLPILTELCIPYVKLGGVFLAMKGSGGDLELAEAERAIALLGGRVVCMYESHLSNGLGEELTRTVAEIKKVAHTPALYPRHFSKISKKPL
jgi:16S rRNA (guanine527-N7)-methyltransferase